MASAAVMPDFIAVCVPLILGTFRNPAVQPTRQPPGKGQFRNRLEAAFIQRPRAIGNAPPAFEHVANSGVRLETLEFLEGRQMRV
jgi:hypothetical protein